MQLVRFFATVSIALSATAVASAGIEIPPQPSGVNVTSAAARLAGVGGISNQFAYAAVNVRESFGGMLPTTIRPNGQSTWDGNYGNQVSSWINDFQVGIAASTAESWMQSNAVGQWQVAFDGSSTYNTFDTSFYYTQLMDRQYIEMTSASVQLFENIKANGLTGTFTFTLTEPHYSKGQGFAYISAASGFASANLDGSTFQMTLNQALSADAMLTLQFQTGTFLGYVGGGSTNTAYLTQISETVYGAAVPAPGAIALLGLVGLTRRSRR